MTRSIVESREVVLSIVFLSRVYLLLILLGCVLINRKESSLTSAQCLGYL